MLKKPLALLLCFATHLFGGGLALYEIGTTDLGLASAGWAARAEDAGTAFTNPAGMTRIKSSQFMMGAQPLYLHVKFKPNSQTTVSGTDGRASPWIPAGGAYFVKPVNEHISVGFASIGYFGSVLKFGHHWVGRYYLTRATCQGFSFVPGAAYRLTDCFSIGVSANIMYAISRTHTLVNDTLDNNPKGHLDVTGANWAVGAVVGALYELDACTRFGVQYVSEVKQKFNMKAKFSNIGPKLTQILSSVGLLNSQVGIQCDVPNWVMLSAYRVLTPCIAIMGNVGWQQWSRFARADISLNNDNSTTLTVTPKYKDTWHAAIGLQCFINACSKATFGFAYDSTMVSNSNRTLSLPIGPQWRFATGYQHAVRENLQLFAAYELAWSGDLKLFQSRGPLAGTVAGKFRNTCIHFFNLGFIWDF